LQGYLTKRILIILIISAYASAVTGAGKGLQLFCKKIFFTFRKKFPLKNKL